MSDKTFVDTSVLICAHDVEAGRKHDVSRDLLRALWADRAGMISTQVLQELYVNATRKIPKPLTKPEARSVVEAYASWCVDGMTPGDIIAAFQIEDRARIGFWDALIVAVAARSGARRIVSEGGLRTRERRARHGLEETQIGGDPAQEDRVVDVFAAVLLDRDEGVAHRPASTRGGGVAVAAGAAMASRRARTAMATSSRSSGASASHSTRWARRCPRVMGAGLRGEKTRSTVAA